MDRLTRKQLKTDKFAQEVGHTFEFLTEHRSQVKRYGVLIVAVLLIAAGVYLYMRHQGSVRRELLAQAMLIDDAVVSPTPQPPHKNFATAEEKEKARIAAYTELATKYSGSQEGAIAHLVLAAAQVDKGQIDEAAKIFKDASESSPAAFASVAQLSLAQIYVSQGKTADAEKLLRPLIDKPTVFVSREQATLALAQALAKTKPAEARKLLEPLSGSSRTAVSRAAVNLLGTISASSAPAQAN